MKLGGGARVRTSASSGLASVLRSGREFWESAGRRRRDPNVREYASFKRQEALLLANVDTVSSALKRVHIEAISSITPDEVCRISTSKAMKSFVGIKDFVKRGLIMMYGKTSFMRFGKMDSRVWFRALCAGCS
jgi:hypothetical protein